MPRDLVSRSGRAVCAAWLVAAIFLGVAAGTDWASAQQPSDTQEITAQSTTIARDTRIDEYDVEEDQPTSSQQGQVQQYGQSLRQDDQFRTRAQQDQPTFRDDQYRQQGQFQDQSRQGQSYGQTGRYDQSQGQAESRGASQLGLSFQSWDQGGGLIVSQISPNSIAANAGLRPGDQIVAVNGQRVQSQQDLNRWIQNASGSRIQVIVFRDGRQQIVWLAPDARMAPGGQFGQVRNDLQQEDYYAGRFNDGRNVMLGVILDPRYEDGAMVDQVIPNSPAEQAGLRRGDYIISVNGRRVGAPSELVRIVEQLEPGRQLQLEFTRRQRQNAQVVLGSPQRIMDGRQQQLGQGGRYGEDRSFESRSFRGEASAQQGGQQQRLQPWQQGQQQFQPQQQGQQQLQPQQQGQQQFQPQQQSSQSQQDPSQPQQQFESQDPFPQEP